MLLQNTVHFKEMPLRGAISHTWDMAFSTKKHRDYTTGSSVIWNELGVAYVRNLVRDRFNPTDMAKSASEASNRRCRAGWRTRRCSQRRSSW